jgi:Na+/H+ antiporter NhaD/arsenite permease-like protein
MTGIACRQIGRVRLPIWTIMLGGAGAVLLTGAITPSDAMSAINSEILIFLFCVFVIGSAMEESGYLAHLASRIFSSQTTGRGLMLLFIITMGAFSALLMNDTLAIIGTPIALILARTCGIPDRAFLLALAGAVTTGSVVSPIGNPQNLLIALSDGVGNPFLSFFTILIIPTALCGVVMYYVILRLYPGIPETIPPVLFEVRFRDQKTAGLCRLSLLLLISLIIIRIILISLSLPPLLTLESIAIIAAAPILILSARRLQILKKVDYPTLIFFIGLFILMEAVWETGAIQHLIPPEMMVSFPILITASILTSQVISNVPFVALLIPSLLEAGAPGGMYLALAAGSTIAGNLTILGAASNVIIIQNAERRGATLTFMDFLRFGIPVTVLQSLIFIGWFMIIG